MKNFFSHNIRPWLYFLGIMMIPLSVFVLISLYNDSFTEDMYENLYRYNVKTETLHIYWDAPETSASVETAGLIAKVMREKLDKEAYGNFVSKKYSHGVYEFVFVSPDAASLYDFIEDTLLSFPELPGSRVQIEYDEKDMKENKEFQIGEKTGE